VAQWGDLPSFADTNSLLDVLQTGEQESEVRNNCFQVSQIKGRSDPLTTYKSDLSKLKQYYKDGSRMSKIKLCGTLRDLDGIQGFTTNEAGEELELGYIGQNFNCSEWAVPEDSWVAFV